MNLDLDQSVVLVLMCTTFLCYIRVYTGVHLVVSLEWGIHGLCILMNSFDLRCEDVTYILMWHLKQN